LEDINDDFKTVWFLISQNINFDLFDYYKIEAFIDGNKLENFSFTILSKTLVKFDLIYDINSLASNRLLQEASGNLG
jgi:hypothetical protein